MKVLLLYPEFPDTFWSFKHALKFIRKKASLPPLGLLTVAAMLPADWAKRLVDVNVRKLRDQDLAWADVVFISGMIAQQDSAHELIARCRAAGKTIVAGGPLFTLGHEQFPEVDHFVLNEAEVTLPEFLRDFERGAARRVYASTEFPDLRQTPAPLWELADLRRYASMSLQYLARLPVRLRVLQRHRDVRTSAAHQDHGAGDRRAGRPPPGRLARGGLLRGRQFHRQQTRAQGGVAAGVDPVAARPARHAVLHRGVHQSGRR